MKITINKEKRQLISGLSNYSLDINSNNGGEEYVVAYECYNGESAALNIMGEVVVTAKDYEEVEMLVEKYFYTNNFDDYSISVVISPFSGETYNDYGQLLK